MRVLLLFFTLFILAILLMVIESKTVTAENTAGILPHKTDFLTLPACGECNSTWYPRAKSTDRAQARQQIKDRAYTHWYLSVTSSSHSYYENPNGFKVFLQELVNDGIKPVVWLTSDTGTWKDKSISSIKSDLTAFIPVIDSLVDSYSLGIEIDEYWTKSEVDEIGAHLNSLTNQPLAVHQLPNRRDYCAFRWCDYMILQYGFNRTKDQIKTITTNAINSLSKPVVAGEYHTDETAPNYEQTSIRLGNAALTSCAAGFGNGWLHSPIAGFTGAHNDRWGVNDGLVDSNSAASRIHGTTRPGDANMDGQVGGQDYDIWLNNYGTVTTSGSAGGDFNRDTKVDGQDYVIWLNNDGL